jgi:hypothetical protein
MASADFSKRIPWPCGIGSLIARHVWRSPRVRRNPFPRLPPDLPMSHPSGYRASLSMARLPCEHRPCIRFLFVGSEFCLRLPPDLASRQRPCLQLTVPTTTACSGLAPYRITSCLAHQKDFYIYVIIGLNGIFMPEGQYRKGRRREINQSRCRKGGIGIARIISIGAVGNNVIAS